MRQPLDPHRSVNIVIKEISRLFTRNFEARVRGHGADITQWQALAALSRREGIKQHAPGARVETIAKSLGRLIDRMPKAGWVERRPAPNDRRAVQLYLTPKVEPIVDDMMHAGALTREEALADFDPREREQLLTMLLRVKANLSGEPAPAAAPASPDDGHAVHERRSRPQASRSAR